MHVTLRKFSVYVAIAVSVSTLGSVTPTRAQTLAQAQAQGFDPDSVLTDNDILSVDAMSFDYLKRFLRSKGKLADLKVTDIDGIEKTAAEVIWRVANSYRINPKYLIALLQKEQSLVEDPSPSQKQLDWATGYAVCDDCSMDDPDIQSFKGFANQVEWAAKQHREKYLMQLLTGGLTIAGRGVNKPVTIDGIVVTPKNNATAMLYSYTPHISGNLSLWNIWRRWFSLSYPNGTVIRGLPSKTAYLIHLGEKRAFASSAVLASMTDPKKILETSDSELSAYPDGQPVRFPKYSLLRTPDGAVSLLVTNGLRKFGSMEAFRKFGFLEDEIIDVEAKEIEDIQVLEPITATTVFPVGALVKTAQASSVWYVENGIRQPLQDGIFLKLYFAGRPIKIVSAKTVESYELGDVYRLHDGELVRGSSSPAVYVVEDGKLKPIPSADIFESLGWKWHNVVKMPDRVIATYEIGDPLDPTAKPPGTVQLVQN